MKKRSTRCFLAIIIVKRLKKNVVANSFFIVVTTFSSFSNFFHFFFFSFFFFHRCRRCAIFHHFVVKFSFDFNSFDFENVQQLLIFSFKKTKLIFYCFRFLFRLSQEILKTFHFRVRDICLIMSYIINNVDHVINLMLLFHLLLHASDMTIEFINDDEQNFVIIVDQVLIDHLIENSNRFFLMSRKRRDIYFFINLYLRAFDEIFYKNASINFMMLIAIMFTRFHFANALFHFNANQVRFFF